MPNEAKYGNTKIIVNGERFDSKKEYRRFCELQLLARAKKISNLSRQVKYTLIPAQKNEKGKVLERECSYIADFVYYDLEQNKYIVEDSKGVRTKDYIIKRKLMLYINSIRIVEV